MISFDWHRETSAPRQQNGLRVIMSSISLEGKKNNQLACMTKLFESFNFNGSSTLVVYKPQIRVTREFEGKIPRPKLRDSDSGASGMCCCKAQILWTLNSPQYPLLIQEKKKYSI